jgi:hypothetical protein
MYILFNTPEEAKAYNRQLATQHGCTGTTQYWLAMEVEAGDNPRAALYVNDGEVYNKPIEELPEDWKSAQIIPE